MSRSSFIRVKPTFCHRALPGSDCLLLEAAFLGLFLPPLGAGGRAAREADPLLLFALRLLLARAVGAGLRLRAGEADRVKLVEALGSRLPVLMLLGLRVPSSAFATCCPPTTFRWHLQLPLPSTNSPALPIMLAGRCRWVQWRCCCS